MKSSCRLCLLGASQVIHTCGYCIPDPCRSPNQSCMTCPPRNRLHRWDALPSTSDQCIPSPPRNLYHGDTKFHCALRIIVMECTRRTCSCINSRPHSQCLTSIGFWQMLTQPTQLLPIGFFSFLIILLYIPSSISKI